MSLEEALAALREETTSPADADAVAATKRRVLLAATEQRRRRVTLVRWVLPIAAVLVVGTAWAAWRARVPSHVDERGNVPPPPPPSVAPAPEPPPPPAPTPSPAPTPPPTPPPPRAPTTDPEEDLYRVAHRAHFVDHDEAASLAACDAYLAKYPNGRFAPEAKYNRALALVSLGRTEEARAALAPFADGFVMGGYRQTEARALLGRLK